MFYTFFLQVCGLSFQMPFEEVLNFALIAFSFLICTFLVFKKKSLPCGKSNKDFLRFLPEI